MAAGIVGWHHHSDGSVTLAAVSAQSTSGGEWSPWGRVSAVQGHIWLGDVGGQHAGLEPLNVFLPQQLYHSPNSPALQTDVSFIRIFDFILRELVSRIIFYLIVATFMAATYCY